MKHSFKVPEQKRIRLLIDTDAKNEADDQFAIAHALLTPKFDVKGLIAAHFGTQRSARSMQESREEILKLLDLMGMTGAVPVLEGAERALQHEGKPERLTPGAARILEEAASDDPRPLFVILLGPLTDLAEAWLANPSLASRLTAVWIGGGAWPHGEREFNLENDVLAANVVFKSGIPLWQVPRDVYSTIRVSLAELEDRVQPCGALGEYLFRQMLDVNERNADNRRWPAGESWALGDSPAVSLLLDPHEYQYDWVPAPQITKEMAYVPSRLNRPIRVYRRVDARFTLEDMYAKLRRFARES